MSVRANSKVVVVGLQSVLVATMTGSTGVLEALLGLTVLVTRAMKTAGFQAMVMLRATGMGVAESIVLELFRAELEHRRLCHEIEIL